MPGSYDGDLPSPEPTTSYVCWMDIMGTGNKMYQNISAAAQRILDFQMLVKDLETKPLTIYPMMDGVYVVSENSGDMLDFIDRVFETAASQVIQRDPEDRYVIRSGVSYGPIVKGKDFPVEDIDDKYTKNIESLLMGPPMVEAYGVEEKAPPFGIAIHESARSFTPEDLQYQWYTWFTPEKRDLANDLRKILDSYFDDNYRHSHMTNYRNKKIEEHQNKMEIYLPEIKLKGPK